MSGAPPSGRQLVGLGASIAGSVIFGLVAGFLLDSLLHTSPLFVFIGLAAGVFSAVALTVFQFRRLSLQDSATTAQEVTR